MWLGQLFLSETGSGFPPWMADALPLRSQDPFLPYQHLAHFTWRDRAFIQIMAKHFPVPVPVTESAFQRGLLMGLMLEWMWLRKRVPQPPGQYFEVSELLLPSFRFQQKKNTSPSVYFHYKELRFTNSWRQPVLHIMLKELSLFFFNTNPSFCGLVNVFFF